MLKAVNQVKLDQKRVILRAGFDVPLKQTKEKEHFVVADDSRVKDALPTINYLIDSKSKIVIIAHLGRPEGKWDLSKSLWPVADDLARLLNRKAVRVSSKLPNYNLPHVYFLESDITQKDYSSLTKKLKPGDILFLENLRFYPGEEQNDDGFAKTLSSFGEIYVNDAFSVAHRKAASTHGLTLKLKSYAGISLMKEITALSKILKNPAEPMVVVMGGAKISDKIDTINNLAKRAEKVLVGGIIANAFIKAKGYDIGASKVAEVDLAKELLRNYGDKIVLPTDLVVAKNPEEHSRVATLDKILPYESIFDIGPKTVTKFSKIIESAKTLVWNGPMGKFEVAKYSFGSKALAQAFASRSKGPAFGVVGGGETLEAIEMAKVGEFIDHLSTGGGAMLEFLSGKKLPAIKALEN
ncbi:MAG TPA: phosphoglycerate kinase [Verrucomicrobiae bacterium]|nr:phosphoglycerate kinase [Verrucomicrobiae bacterium]